MATGKVVIHNRVARLRLEYEYKTKKRMSQGDLAKALGVSRAYLSKVENQKAKLSPEIEAKIVEIFGLKSMDELYTIIKSSDGEAESGRKPNHRKDKVA